MSTIDPTDKGPPDSTSRPAENLKASPLPPQPASGGSRAIFSGLPRRKIIAFGSLASEAVRSSGVQTPRVSFAPPMIRQFSDPDVLAMADFMELAAPFGLSKEAIVDLAWRATRDDVSEYYDGRQDQFKEGIVLHAKEYRAAAGCKAFCVSGLFFNMNALNSKEHDDSEAANVHIKKVASILESNLRGTGAIVVPMRTDGKKVGVVLVGEIDEDRVKAAMRAAEEEIAQYAERAGLSQLINPKGSNEVGFGLHLGIAEITDLKSPTTVFAEADRNAERSKIARFGEEAEDANVSKNAAKIRRRPALPIRPFVFQMKRGKRGLDPDTAIKRDFAERARRHGLTRLAIDTLTPRAPIDSVTRFFDGRVNHIKAATVRRIQRHLENPAVDDVAYYVAGDLANLAGLNIAMGDDMDFSDPHYRSIAGIVADELSKLGADVIPMRTGGDEFGIAITGKFKEQDLVDAMARARERVREYVEENDLADIPHLKRENEKGVGVHLGYSEILPGVPLKHIFSAAEVGIARSKRANA